MFLFLCCINGDLRCRLKRWAFCTSFRVCIQWDKDDRKLPVNMCSCVGRSKFRFEFHSEACSRILKHNLLAYYPGSPDCPYTLFRPGYRKLLCLCKRIRQSWGGEWWVDQEEVFCVCKLITQSVVKFLVIATEWLHSSVFNLKTNNIMVKVV